MPKASNFSAGDQLVKKDVKRSSQKIRTSNVLMSNSSWGGVVLSLDSFAAQANPLPRGPRTGTSDFSFEPTRERFQNADGSANHVDHFHIGFSEGYTTQSASEIRFQDRFPNESALANQNVQKLDETDAQSRNQALFGTRPPPLDEAKRHPAERQPQPPTIRIPPPQAPQKPPAAPPVRITFDGHPNPKKLHRSRDVPPCTATAAGRPLLFPAHMWGTPLPLSAKNPSSFGIKFMKRKKLPVKFEVDSQLPPWLLAQLGRHHSAIIRCTMSISTTDD